MSGRPALFLDRDGVINVDHGYVYRSEDFEFIDGIFDLCQSAQSLGYTLIVITNQAGIGRGYYTEDDFHRLTEWMCAEFEREGICISGVYFCPYHPDYGVGSYKIESECRKPNPGMLLQAAKEQKIDMEKSVLIGDKKSDIEAGMSAGVELSLLYCPEHDCHLNVPSLSRLIDAVPYLESRAQGS